MKRILFFVALVLGVVSCQSDLDDFGANVGGEQEVIVNVSLPEETRANSAEGGISNVIASDDYTVRYIFKVYNADGTQSKEAVKQYSDNKSVSFPVRLVPNRNYRFVVWADIVKESDKADLHYNTTNFPEISLNGTWVAMDETRDAYTVSELVTEFNSAKSISLTLKRPLAKLRVITTDMEELLGLTPQTATVSYVTEHYNTFNALESEVVGDSKNSNIKHENYTIKEYETTNGKVLFTDYFFAKDDIVKFNISVAMSDGKSVDRSFTTDIPVKRNYLTTLIGDILTDGNNITVNVEEGFENGTEWNPGDDKYDVEIWDGKSTKAPAYDDATKTYTIKLPSELAWLADQVNGVTRAAANDFSGKTFELTQDIDLGFNEWTPIGNNTNKFQGTFDGKGHKIANLLITGNNNYVGLFGFTAGGEIKDFVVENAKVSGRLGVGVIAGSPYTSKFNDITIQGHVEVNGKFYVGGVAGYSAYANWNNITVNVDETSYVDANSVENDVAYRTYVGGVCGFNGEGGHSFTNITSNIDVKGSTIDAGGLFGIAHYGNKFENCSCSGDVEIYAAEEAEEAQEIGGIAGVWNNGGEDVVFTNCTFTGTLKTNIAVDFYYDGLIGKPYSANGKGILWLNGNKYLANGTIEDENGNLIVNSPKSLEAALTTAGAPGAGDTTIVFEENATLNMTNAEWTPIYVNGYNGADIVTIEGNGAVIKGLTAPLFKGGFAGGSGIIIKNLTITESNIVSDNTDGSGAFIECVDSMETITLDNCHFTNSTISGSRTGGLIGWTSGYSNQNDGPVKTYVTIKNCSVIDVDINATGSAAAINGHAGASDWTYTTIENCTVENCNINSTDDGGWRTGVVVGTANVGEVTINNITESGNTLTQTGKTAPEGLKRNYYGRAALGTTGKLTIDGYKYVAEGLFEKENGDQIANSDAGLKAALENGATTVYLSEGSYIVPAAAKGKTVTFIGAGEPEDTQVAVTKVGTGGENCDYGLDGSTATFENITITTNSSTYIGYARCKGTYKNCIINGTYTLYDDSVFEDCTFNVSGDVYNIWTWGAPTATFTDCTFNCDGKAMLLYGTANTKLTMNNCVFNDKGGLADLKAAIEIGNDYNKSYELIVNNATVNGFEINDKGINTGTTLWANKNSMPADKLKVIIDGYTWITDGLSKKDGEYYVSKANGLVYISNNALEGGAAVKLNADINLEDEEFNGLSAFNPENNNTFDGQGHTVSNWTYEGGASDMGFIRQWVGPVKNIKFENCHLKTNGRSAIVAGKIYGNIDNVSVNNCSIEDSYWACGLVAGMYNAGSVSNVTVTNSSVKSNGGTGAIVGVFNETGGERGLKNCSVSNTTINNTGVYGEAYSGGALVGIFNCGATFTIEGCTVSNNTLEGSYVYEKYPADESVTIIEK